MELSTVIKGGIVATASDIFKADIGIRAGKIVAIGESIDADIDQIIDAGGCYVLPGGVDVHTHLDTPSFGMTSVDDFRTGTIAAACGGTTTIVNFCIQDPGRSLAETLLSWHRKAEGKAAIDYGFHGAVQDPTDDVIAELETLPAAGLTSFKLFMAYKYMSQVDDYTLIRTLEEAKRVGALVMVHAENGDAIYHLQKRYVSEGKTAPINHALTRPPRLEAEATARAIALAEVVGTSIYIVHVSCAEVLEEIQRGRARGVDVVAETCTQYLFTQEADLERPNFEGAKFVFTPPPRDPRNHAIMWRSIQDGSLQAVSSDHSPWNMQTQKIRGLNDFSQIPNGAPGIEERLMMVYQGVNAGYLSLTRFVDAVATSPAKIFGLYPEKGTIAIGSDADLVVWDPSAEMTITQAALHQNVDHSVYEGHVVRGIPRTVLLRGELVSENRKFVGQSGSGRFLPRRSYQKHLSGPIEVRNINSADASVGVAAEPI